MFEIAASRSSRLAAVLVIGWAVAGVAPAFAGRAAAPEARASRPGASRPHPRRPPSDLRAANQTLRSQAADHQLQERQLQAVFGAFGPVLARPDRAPAPSTAVAPFSFRRLFARKPPATAGAPRAGRGEWARYDDVRRQAADAVRLVAGPRHERSVLKLATFSLGEDGAVHAVALDSAGDLRIVNVKGSRRDLYDDSQPAADFEGLAGSTLSVRQVEQALDQLPAAIAAATRGGALGDLVMTSDGPLDD